MAVYFAYNPRNNLIKIGYSETPLMRFKRLARKDPDLLLVYFTEGTESTEEILHYIFREYRVYKEWFTYSEEIKGFINDLKSHDIGALLTRYEDDLTDFYRTYSLRYRNGCAGHVLEASPMAL